MTQALVKFSELKKQLLAITSVAEAVGVRDTAAMFATKAKESRLGLATQNQVGGIKIQAEMRAGELLEKMERDQGRKGVPQKTTAAAAELPEYAKALSDNDISQRDARRWQTLSAKLTHADVDRLVAELTKTGDVLTTDAAYRFVRAGGGGSIYVEPDDTRALLSSLRSAEHAGLRLSSRSGSLVGKLAHHAWAYWYSLGDLLREVTPSDAVPANKEEALEWLRV